MKANMQVRWEPRIEYVPLLTEADVINAQLYLSYKLEGLAAGMTEPEAVQYAEQMME